MHFKISTCQVLFLLLFWSSCSFLQNSWYLVHLLDVLSAQPLILLMSHVLRLFDSIDKSGENGSDSIQSRQFLQQRELNCGLQDNFCPLNMKMSSYHAGEL